jgi:Protein of unknown function (DUF3309)
MPVENGETAVILIVVLVIFLFGGFSGRFGGYGYGYGYGPRPLLITPRNGIWHLSIS